MGRAPCCSKQGLNRGTWTSLEDRILAAYIRAHGEGNWRNLPKRAGLKRCGKSCRLRWMNYLRPDIKRGNISPDEEDLILKLHTLLGNRWSMIARRLPGRTDNEIKNYWNATLGKKARAQSSSSSSSPPSSQTAKVTAQHQVIRTKATRCTRVVLPAAPEAVEQTKTDDHSETGSLDRNDMSFLNPNDMVPMDAHDQVLLMEAPQFGDGAGLDLESLAFLLDSSEWPLQENQPCFF